MDKFSFYDTAECVQRRARIVARVLSLYTHKSYSRTHVWNLLCIVTESVAHRSGGGLWLANQQRGQAFAPTGPLSPPNKQHHYGGHFVQISGTYFFRPLISFNSTRKRQKLPMDVRGN